MQAAQEQDPHSFIPSRPEVLPGAAVLCGCCGVVGSGEACCVCLGTPGYPWICLHYSIASATEFPPSVDGCCSDDTLVLLRYLHGLHHSILHSGKHDWHLTMSPLQSRSLHNFDHLYCTFISHTFPPPPPTHTHNVFILHRTMSA